MHFTSTIRRGVLGLDSLTLWVEVMIGKLHDDAFRAGNPPVRIGV